MVGMDDWLGKTLSVSKVVSCAVYFLIQRLQIFHELSSSGFLEVTVQFCICLKSMTCILSCLCKYWPLMICQELNLRRTDSLDSFLTWFNLYSFMESFRRSCDSRAGMTSQWAVSTVWDLWFLCVAAVLQKGLWSDDVAQGQGKEAWETGKSMEYAL